eukprot:SAG25_NODE_521_length_7225_cov_3.656890_7_plen_64_part_00
MHCEQKAHHFSFKETIGKEISKINRIIDLQEKLFTQMTAVLTAVLTGIFVNFREILEWLQVWA